MCVKQLSSCSPVPLAPTVCPGQSRTVAPGKKVQEAIGRVGEGTRASSPSRAFPTSLQGIREFVCAELV